jgi:hypothetical protein
MSLNPDQQSDKSLSQADIDTLMGVTKPKAPQELHSQPGEPSAEVVKVFPPLNVKTIKIQPAVTNPVVTSNMANQPADKEPPNLVNRPQPAQLNMLSEKIALLEAALVKYRKEAESIDNEVRLEVQSLSRQVQASSAQVNQIKAALENTAGYNMAESFQCPGCGTVGSVAIPVRCNACGQTNWWGWWPK